MNSADEVTKWTTDVQLLCKELEPRFCFFFNRKKKQIKVAELIYLCRIGSQSLEHGWYLAKKAVFRREVKRVLDKAEKLLERYL